jgi:hypothetical protein
VAEWSASASFATELPPGTVILIIKPASGGPLADKETETVTVALVRPMAQEFGIEAGTVTFAFPGGSVVVPVTWLNGGGD